MVAENSPALQILINYQAFQRDKDLTERLVKELEEARRHRGSPHLTYLYYSIKRLIGM